MPQRANTICRQPGCGKYVNGDYCAEHAQSNIKTAYDVARASDATRKLYSTARYRRFRDFLLVRNPMCQRIQPDGTRCKNPSKICHHLVDPDAPGGLELFLTASNAVMVCASCHPGGQPGTNWKVNVDYVPTFAGFGFLGQSNPN